jgi:hypothetical protein
MSNRRLIQGMVFLWVLAGFFSACKSRQKAQPVPAAEGKGPQEASVQQLLARLDSTAFKSDWVQGKASVTTFQEGNETSFNINLRARRDSVLWISISPLLGIEVARVLITPDSVKLLDRLNNRYQASSFEAINKLLQLKVNFEIVQSLLFGNFFAYKKNENRFNSVYLEDKFYILSSLNKKKLKRALEEKDLNKPVIQDVYINDAYFKIFKMSVEDQKIGKTLLVEYEDFRQTDFGQFPFKSNTKVTSEKELEIKIEFGKIVVGEIQEFPFNIPSNYERVR